MTFVLAYRLPATVSPNTTLFVNDFRGTWRDGVIDRHADALDKWEIFPDRMAYAAAGPTRYWARARAGIEDALGEIRPETLYEGDGPFAEALWRSALATPDARAGSLLGALGVLLDGDTHHPFVAHGGIGFGVQVRPLEDGEVQIVGPLGLVGGGGTYAALQGRIVQRVRRMVEAAAGLPGHDVPSLLHATREAVMHELEQAGPRVFTAFGITPAMATAAAVEGGFAVLGGKVDGFRIAGGVFHETGYSISRGADGAVEFRDDTTGTENQLRTIADAGDVPGGETMDPERRTTQTDLAALYPDRERVYVLTQDVHRPLGLTADERVDPSLGWLARAIDEGSDMFKKPSLARLLVAVDVAPSTGIQVKRRAVASEGRVLGPDESASDHMGGELSFVIDDDGFESAVRANLFDDEWMSEHVPGYRESLARPAVDTSLAAAP